MEVENSPTLEELANGQDGDVPVAGADNDMPAPAVAGGPEADQRLKRKARRLIRAGSREGQANLVIPGHQAASFVAPHRR